MVHNFLLVFVFVFLAFRREAKGAMPPNEGLSLILARSKSVPCPRFYPTAGDRTTRNCSIRHFLIALQKAKRPTAAGETMREIIADNLSKAGWSCGCVSAIDSNGRTIWIADAHRDDGKRFNSGAHKGPAVVPHHRTLPIITRH
jgi:hypothetical protein